MDKVIEKMLDENIQILKTTKSGDETYGQADMKDMINALKNAAPKTLTEIKAQFCIDLIWSIGGIVLLWKLLNIIGSAAIK